MRLKGKTIVVTGAASGIGRAACLRCATEGAQVAGMDWDGEGLGETVRRIQEAGGVARGIQVDVREGDQVCSAIGDVEASLGRIDGLIAAAGILEGILVPVDLFDEETWDRVIDVNMKGSFWAARYAVPAMERAGGGVIVLISSVAGVLGGSSSVAYGSSKGGVHGLSLVLAAQLAPRNIRVHAVCPGGIETPLKMRVVETQASAQGKTVEAARARLGDPEGVGKILSFLVSDEADHVRGTIFTR